MKIVVVGTRGFPGVQGGVENHCEYLYTHLSKMGCDITVFTRKPYVTDESNEYNGVKLISLDCPRNKFLEAIVHTLKSVIKARKLNPDILHIHAVGPSLFAILARFLGMKVVITNHGPDYVRKKWPLPAKIFLKLCERIGIAYANGIITIAGNLAKDIKDNYGREAAVIPNGVEIPKLAQTEDYIEKFKLEKQKYILAVGRFVPEKGFHDLIDAFVLSGIGEYKLVLVGDADHEDGYSRSLKDKAGKYNGIILTGFLTGQALNELYSYARLFVLPSYYEGLPIVLLEALSYGLSCIASDIPANRNIDMVESRFFSVGDILMLSNKMSHFINEPWEQEDRVGQVNMITEKYNWNAIAGETIKVYECLD
ncbi:putative teichuronic acid biosynthesis glycosyltransferase TuaC [bacterium BMS3Abin15]|nr:putative teichuronic acid biosynthesis glycosyltransferase TuaC [bacterium BMS3Abin15]